MADSLIDKGWDLHLIFGKEGTQKEEQIKGTSSQKTPTKITAAVESILDSSGKRQISPMGVPGGIGRGRRSGNGDDDKKPTGHPVLSDKPHEVMMRMRIIVVLTLHWKLKSHPEQLVGMGANRPILRLRLSPWKRTAMAAPGGGG